MSIKYSIAQIKNPARPDEPGKFYAKAQSRTEVGLNEIADDISYSTTLTDGDVLNVLRALIKNMKKHLENGDTVSLGEFGKFQYLIASKGADSYEEFMPTAHIRKVNIRFRPGKMLQEAFHKISFEKVISVKARKEAAKKEAADAANTVESEE